MKLPFFVVFCLLFSLSVPVFSQWSTDPNVNTAVCTDSSDQYLPAITGDGAGGAIVAWADFRGAGTDIYAQHINFLGVPQWNPNGVPISTAGAARSSRPPRPTNPDKAYEMLGVEGYPEIVSDGMGGAIIAWSDNRSGNADVYAQRVNASGVVQWSIDGVPICTTAANQFPRAVIADGAGGAIITWEDFRNGNNYDIYAQRIDPSGVALWNTNGVAVSAASDGQFVPRLTSDGSNGAIIAWQDNRTGTAQVFAQWVDALGIPLWTPDGVAICGGTNQQFEPAIVGDGSYGAIITWHDSRSGGGNEDIYAQRINSAGDVQWDSNGVAVSAAPAGQYSPTIASDGSGGAIITWYDGRSGTNNDIYAQRVNGTGVAQWSVNGVAICTAPFNQWSPTIVSNAAGGAIITWRDVRTGSNDIYAQKVNATGGVQWAMNGAALCTATREQFAPQIVSDGSGGAIITWYDSRSVTQYDIYAQQVHSSGSLGLVTTRFADSVIAFSSEYSPTSWSAQQTLGVPNTYPNYGDLATAWASLTEDSQREFLELWFSSTAPISEIAIYETYNPGAVDTLYVKNPGTGLWEVVWSGAAQPAGDTARIFRASFPLTSFNVSEVRIAINSPAVPSWNEIDAVAISGSPITSVIDEGVPKGSFTLHQNYPNPFNPSTTFRYELPARAQVDLSVYNVLGQKVADLFNGEQLAGTHTASWDGRNAVGYPVATGVYFYRLKAGKFVETRKMILLK